MTFDIHGVLGELALERPIFHSEHDFQHALAWRIQTQHHDARIRLERPLGREPGRVHVDIIVGADSTVAIELKYSKSEFRGDVKGESFLMTSDGARDVARHGFLKDIMRLEKLVADRSVERGWAVLLTNDPALWKHSKRETVNDIQFHLYEGRVLGGPLGWSEAAGTWTAGKEFGPLQLRGSYECSWSPYATVTASNGEMATFKYLALEVPTERAP